jgi:hypothetical protein
MRRSPIVLSDLLPKQVRYQTALHSDRRKHGVSKGFLLFYELFVKLKTGNKMAKEEPFGTNCPGIVPESLCTLSHFVPIEVALRKKIYFEGVFVFIESNFTKSFS